MSRHSPDGSFGVVGSTVTPLSTPLRSRVLRRGGTFLTQQVGGRNLADLIEQFGGRPQFPDITLNRLSTQLRGAGFTIGDAQEHRLATRFDNVGALVCSTSERCPTMDGAGFSVAKYRRELLALQAQLDSGAPLSFTSRRFLVKCALAPA